MSKIYMLTKPDCPNCNRLKLYLHTVLKDKYKEDITVVDKEKEYDFFVEMVKKHMVLALPVLIKGDEILIDMKPELVKNFLYKHTGK
jgi:glutaredoxin-like protein NrdH